MVLPAQIKKFKKIYKEKFGQELSDKEALEQALKLLTLVKLVYKPIKKDRC